MEESLITWNLPNWITVVLMAALGFMVLAVIGSFVKGKMGGGPQAGA